MTGITIGYLGRAQDCLNSSQSETLRAVRGTCLKNSPWVVNEGTTSGLVLQIFGVSAASPNHRA
jgi:hypothetical protein